MPRSVNAVDTISGEAAVAFAARRKIVPSTAQLAMPTTKLSVINGKRGKNSAAILEMRSVHTFA